MKLYLRKLVLSNRLLTIMATNWYKRRLVRKHEISYGNDVFIGFSTICEGKNFFDSNSSIVGSKIGYGSYLAAGTNIIKSQIGRYTSIGPNVNCIFGKHPTNTFVSTHPAFYSINRPCDLSYTDSQKFKEYEEAKDIDGKYSIIIGNDVWIGANVSIMDGVSIGNGSIVASNSLVNNDIPAYSIYGGVPAKFIKKRFDDDEIKFLEQLEWWNKSEEWIIKHADYFTDIKRFQKVIHGN